MLVAIISLPLVGYDSTEKVVRRADIAVLYTGDVHCVIDENIGYAGLAAFKSELEAEGVEVLLVDTGDAIQGTPMGSLSEGALPIKIMNHLGYSAMTLGNHEFDYGQAPLSTLSKEAHFPFLSLNFVDEATRKPVYRSYTIVERDGVKIAFVGVSTPKTLISSRPTHFMDKKGDYLYSFLQDKEGELLWETTQQVVDAARKDGADYVIALTHLGINSDTAPYLSNQLIANTKGIDVVLDGHSHSIVECERVRSKDGKRVLLSSTGTELSHIGYLLIGKDGNLSTGLISDYAKKDAATVTYINSLKKEFEQQLKQPVALVKNHLVTDHAITGVRIVRNRETNLGNLCADAIRSEANADVAVMNGGGIRASMKAGEITYGDVLNVFPFGNHIRTIEVTGQQLLDALELSVSSFPAENGGFLQVSGLTFTFRTDIPTPVIKDNTGMFTGVKGKRRVQEVWIDKKPLEANKTYSLAGTDYTLGGGDGYAMFADSRVLEGDVGLDFDALISFLRTGYLQNTSLYENPNGEGRIVAIP